MSDKHIYNEEERKLAIQTVERLIDNQLNHMPQEYIKEYIDGLKSIILAKELEHL